MTQAHEVLGNVEDGNGTILSLKDLGPEVLEDFISKLREDREVDQRWVSIAETHFQQGLLAVKQALEYNSPWEAIQ